MLSEEQIKEFSSLQVEIIDLNVLTCFFIRKINRFGYLFHHSTRHYLFEEFTALRYMENGIILHLTNLDDDSSLFSFRAIYKELNRNKVDRTKLSQFKTMITSYRQNLNKLKNNHRNKRIAHLNYTTELNMDEFLDFNSYLKPIIGQAFKIADFIWGEKIMYRYKLGSLEGIINFRLIFEDLEFDINAQREFV